ncbi:MAG: hypothetical protein V1929_06885 [bacterium]
MNPTENASDTSTMCRVFPLGLVVLILFIAGLNLLFPHNYLFFAIDHVSYLPVSGQILFCLAALGAITLIARSPEQAHPSRPWMIFVGLVLTTSLMVFRTRFPVMQGDGFRGGWTLEGSGMGEHWWDVERLQSFLAYGLCKVVPDHIRFVYFDCGFSENLHRDNVWILLTLLSGVFTIWFITTLLFRSRLDGRSSIGLQVTLLCSAPFLNAYGHFDSYIIPVVMTMLWLSCLFAAHQGHRAAWFALAPILMCGIWAHPILGWLLGHTVFFAAFVLLHARGRFVHPAALLILGLAYSFLPLLAGRANLDLIRSSNTGILPWLLHERVMSGLQVSLPALWLAVPVLWANRRTLRKPNPIQALAIVLLVSTVSLCFTLWLGYGLKDEFIYSIMGTLILGAAVFLYLGLPHSPRLMLYIAVLSAYLFVPRMIVYSNENIIERFGAHFRRDRCESNRICSPYRVYAVCLPVETKAFRDQRLAILKEGFENPVPQASDLAEECRAFHAAWCFEFGYWPEARDQLEHLLLSHSPYVWRLFEINGPFYTSKYLNRAGSMSRVFARRLVEGGRLRELPEDHRRVITCYLDQMDVIDPPHPEHSRLARLIHERKSVHE